MEVTISVVLGKFYDIERGATIRFDEKHGEIVIEAGRQMLVIGADNSKYIYVNGYEDGDRDSFVGGITFECAEGVD